VRDVPPGIRDSLFVMGTSPESAKRQDRSTIKQHESLNGHFLVIFMVIAMSMFRIASWAAGRIILLLAYGRTRVSREHLELVKIKPQLLVSNGDVLWNKGFEHFLIGQTIWIPTTCLLLVLAWKLLPEPYHDAMQQNKTYVGWSLAAAILLFFAMAWFPLKLILPLAAGLLVVLLLNAARPSHIPKQT
jgi:hypothetical protein